MIEQIIAIGGGLASMYQAITSVGTGSFQKRVVDLLKRQEAHLARLTDHILYSATSQTIQLERQSPIRDPREIREVLEPVQRALRTDIIASSVMPTPPKLQAEFALDPWNCLDDIRPVELTRFNRSDDWVPLMFDHSNQTFVGWQKRGMLKVAMGFAYDPSIDAWRRSPLTTPRPPSFFRNREPTGLALNTGLASKERPRRYTFDQMVSRVKGVSDPTTIFDLLPDLFRIVDGDAISREIRWGLWALMTDARIKALGPQSRNVEERYWTYAAAVVWHNTSNIPAGMSDAEQRSSVRAFLEGVILIERERASKA